MLTFETAELEFEEQDRRLAQGADDLDEFDRMFDLEHDKVLFDGDPYEVARSIKKEVDRFMRMRGHPGEHDKIVAHHDATMRWEPAGDVWREGPMPGRPLRFGAYGGSWWCVRFERDYEAPEYKQVKLYQTAIQLEDAETEEEKLMAAVKLGMLRERFANHDRHLHDVRTGLNVRAGGRKGAKAAREMDGHRSDERYAEMKRLINDDKLSISEAARRLEKRGLGTVEANRKLWARRMSNK
ncbi:MAG: hypothetical protein AAF322_00305 [Pseudomonadota bacterium]